MKQELEKIRAKCVELLEIAKKRTPGKWAAFADGIFHGNSDIMICGACACDEVIEIDSEANAAFIASCAGPAEAGWRATIAAIDAILESCWTTVHWHAIHQVAAKKILTAWEGLV